MFNANRPSHSNHPHPASRVSMRRQHRLAVGLMAGVLLVSMPGCVQRRLMIRSDPPGAMVYVDDYQIGPTPIATTFTYYGTRKVRLVKDGFQTLTVYERIDPPWYEIPPLDFFSENILGREIRDMRVLDYRLVPQVVSPPQNLLDRAEELRARSQTPLPPSVVPVN